MRCSLCTFVSIIVVAASSVYAVNGTGAYVPYTGGWRDRQGDIVSYRVENDVVVTQNPIYTKTAAMFPVFNGTGDKIAFFKVTGGKTILAAMDRDGGNVKDLVTFPEESFEGLHDWPLGDWVYYFDQGTFDVWKVNYNDPAQKEKVVTYHKLRRASFWSLNLAGDKGVYLNFDCSGDSPDNLWCNIPHDFPFESSPRLGNLSRNCWGGCHPFMSASGDFFLHYFTAGHEKVRINKWMPDQCLETHDVHIDDVSQWAGGANLGNRYLDVFMATNSDKWLLAETAISNNKRGSKLVLINWIDNKAIIVADNEVTAEPGKRASSGDFFVDGPIGAYETIHGSWYDAQSGVQVEESSVKRSLPAPSRGGKTAHVSLYPAENSLTEYFTITGKRIRSRQFTGKTAGATRGVFIAQPKEESGKRIND